MNSIVSFFVSLFSILVWLIALAALVAVILLFVNKPLISKCINAILDTDYLQRNINTAGNKVGTRSRKGKSISPDDKERFNDKLEQTLRRINELEQQNELINNEIEIKDETIINLRSQLIATQNELSTLKQRIIHMDGLTNNNEEKTNIPKQQHELLYSYAPTSVSPYGFSINDWQANDSGHIFVMKKISDNQSAFCLNNKRSNANILGALAYYDRLIDYEDNTNGNNASKIEILKEGKLRLKEGVWTIESKIKIKLL